MNHCKNLERILVLQGNSIGKYLGLDGLRWSAMMNHTRESFLKKPDAKAEKNMFLWTNIPYDK